MGLKLDNRQKALLTTAEKIIELRRPENPRVALIVELSRLARLHGFDFNDVFTCLGGCSCGQEALIASGWGCKPELVTESVHAWNELQALKTNVRLEEARHV